MLAEAPTVGDGAMNADDLASIKKRKMMAVSAEDDDDYPDAISTKRSKVALHEIDGDDMDSETELLYAQAVQGQDEDELATACQQPRKRSHGAYTLPLNRTGWPPAPATIGVPSRAGQRQPGRSRSKAARIQPASPKETRPTAAPGTPAVALDRHQSRPHQTPSNPAAAAAAAEPSLTGAAPAVTHRGWEKCVQIETLKLSDSTCKFFQPPSRAKADMKQKFGVEMAKLLPYLQHLEVLFSASGSQTTNQTIKSDLTALKKLGTTKVDKRLGQDGKDNSYSVKCGYIRTLFESGRDLRALCIVPHRHLDLDLNITLILTCSHHLSLLQDAA